MGRTKLGLTDKETGRLTFHEYRMMIKAYRDNFTLESFLLSQGRGYDIENNSNEEIIEL